MTVNPFGDKPTLEALMKQAQAAGLGKIHTCMPAVVLDYNATNQTATVQPVLRARRVDPQTGAVDNVLPEPIPGVPVGFPNGTGWSLAGPITGGDWVMLVVAERSIDEWMDTGNRDITPADTRRFDWSDAVAIPAGRPSSDPLPVTAVDILGIATVLRSNNLKLGSTLATEAIVLESLLTPLRAALIEIQAALVALGYVAPPLPPLVALPALISGLGVAGTFRTSKVKAE